MTEIKTDKKIDAATAPKLDARLKELLASGESRLVVLDDGSKDRTYSILKDACADHPLLIPVKKENQGHGATVLYGYRYALEQEPDYIFQTDSYASLCSQNSQNSRGSVCPSESVWKI